MAAALPCIVTDVGSMATHVLKASAGLVVEPDPDAVAAAIEAAVGPEWGRRSAGARQYALENFSSDEIARAYLRDTLFPSTAGVTS
jgi:glycosyltransferase involved in cell wall biosynthesis